eukprot:NODE_4189_length_1924_cov_7.468559.p15 GENE.NODE_4189_length_1924_cov_7.468559~~NODE_4189_length_1924_cov_7.468559.p15  ORF type:complete len:67 (-),score=9.20 NODE_4189_length_1924_cov_7.468559:1393-1593(-)
MCLPRAGKAAATCFQRWPGGYALVMLVIIVALTPTAAAGKRECKRRHIFATLGPTMPLYNAGGWTA